MFESCGLDVQNGDNFVKMLSAALAPPLFLDKVNDGVVPQWSP